MSGGLKTKQRIRASLMAELAIIFFLGAVIYVISIFIDTHEIFKRWAGDKSFAGVELTEFFVLLSFLVLASFIFALRRWKELNREIIGRKNTEACLWKSENKFRSLFNQAADSIFLLSFDKDGGLIIEDTNDAACAIHGYTREELIGKPIAFLDDEETKKHIPERAKILREEKQLNFEARHIRKDGTIFQVEVSARLIYIGNTAYILAIDRNITDRKRIEELLLIKSVELNKRNLEVASLYKITTAISHSINLNDTLTNLLNAVIEFEAFRFERRGGIFFVEDDNMRLVSHLGHSEFFLDLHKNLKVGDCLCGLAAQTGAIIISKNSDTDDRHTIKYPEMFSHGHIILPIKIAGNVIAVLYLYTPPDISIGDETMKLLFALESHISVAIENSRLYEQAKELALFDPLTKVANRLLMDIELKKNFARAKRFHNPLSIMMIDLDDFKQYNDNCGHIAGDKLLVEIASIFLREVRTIDLVARYGGEEFLIILPDTELSEAHKAAERIRKSVKEKTDITVSIGISNYSKEITQAEEIIKNADEALYLAKHKGKNRIEISN
ncbi:MAG: diguanylate cyclase [Nitrospirae bacterium]|nr:diguanylate cyclase [Nitrospirota bacterium]